MSFSKIIPCFPALCLAFLAGWSGFSCLRARLIPQQRAELIQGILQLGGSLVDRPDPPQSCSVACVVTRMAVASFSFEVCWCLMAFARWAVFSPYGIAPNAASHVYLYAETVSLSVLFEQDIAPHGLFAAIS